MILPSTTTYDSSRFLKNPVTHRQDNEGNILAFSFSLWPTKLRHGGFSFRSCFFDLVEWLIDSVWIGFARERARVRLLWVRSDQEAGDVAHAIGDRNFHTRGFYFNGRLTAACLGARTHGGSRSHPSIHPPHLLFSVHPCLFRLIASSTVCTIRLTQAKSISTLPR
jgi:hypothetical protein